MIAETWQSYNVAHLSAHTYDYHYISYTVLKFTTKEVSDWILFYIWKMGVYRIAQDHIISTNVQTENQPYLAPKSVLINFMVTISHFLPW